MVNQIIFLSAIFSRRRICCIYSLMEFFILNFIYYFYTNLNDFLMHLFSRVFFVSFRCFPCFTSIQKNYRYNNFCMNGNILKGSYLTKPCERFFHSDFNILAAPSLWLLFPPPFQVSKHIYPLIVLSIDHY